MFGYELKRIVKSKIFIILIVLLLAYFTYLTVNYFRYNSENIKYYKDEATVTNTVLSEVSAKNIDSESLYNELKKELIALDAIVFSDTKDQMTEEEWMKAHERYITLSSARNTLEYQFVEYPQLIQTTLTKAIMLANDSTQDSYTIRVNQKAIDKYNTKKEFSLVDRKPASIWYDMYTMYYEYFYVFLAFAFVILAADVFCYEKTRSLEGMVFTSKKGRGNLFTAKLCSLLLVAFFVMLIFTVVDICAAHYIMGGKLLLEPIQALPVFQSSTVNINFLTLIICCGLFRFTVLVLVIALAAAVSQLSRKVFVSIVIDLVVMFGLFALYVYAAGYNIVEASQDSEGNWLTSETFDSARFALYEKLRGFLPSCLTNPMAYFEKFDYVNVASFPFTRATTCLSLTVIVAAVFILFALFRFGNVLKFIPRIKKAKEAK